MYKRVEIEKYIADIKDVANELGNPKCEMSDNEKAFVCGLISEKKPKKILEVGVAEGGTTSTILKWLEKQEIDAKMYSVDLSEEYYANSSLKTGYVVEELRGILPKTNEYRLILGKFLPEVIDEIGNDIDFVILDTVHYMPGEVLDYICLLPYLKKGATVVLHDIALSLSEYNSKYAYATTILLATASGEKYWNGSLKDEYYTPNVAAIAISDVAKVDVDDIFVSLMTRWNYKLTDSEIEKYRAVYERFYHRDIIELFDSIIKRQIDIIDKSIIKKEKIVTGLIDFVRGKKVYIYGAGFYGKRLKSIIEKQGVLITSFVVSDGHCTESDKEVIDFSTYIRYRDKDSILLYAVDNDELYWDISLRVEVKRLPKIVFDY